MFFFNKNRNIGHCGTNSNLNSHEHTHNSLYKGVPEISSKIMKQSFDCYIRLITKSPHTDSLYVLRSKDVFLQHHYAKITGNLQKKCEKLIKT